MTEFFLTPGQIQSISFGFLFFVLAVAAFFLFTSAYRDRIAMWYAALAVFGALVNLFAFLYSTTDSTEVARLLRTVSQAFSVPFIITLVGFTLVVYEKYLPLSHLYRQVGYVISLAAVLFGGLFLSDIFASTTYLIGDLGAPPSVQLTPEPGLFLHYFIGFFLFVNIYSLFLMLMLWKSAASREGRVMGILMLMALEIPLLTRLAGYLPWYGYGANDYISLGVTLLTGPIFAFGVTYAILRHRIFNVRLIATELLIFGLWALLFFRVLLAESFAEGLPDLILLIAVMVLGVFLIRSVLKEVRQRETLEKVSNDLTELNETLESKVRERTEELADEKEHVETIVENLPVGIIELSGRGEIVRLNEAAEALLGVSEKRIKGKRVTPRTPGELDSLRAVLSAEPKKGKRDEKVPEGAAEIMIEHPERREVQVIRLPLQIGGREGTLLLVRDVTRERMVDRAKTEFVSIAAHQLRTPVSGLRWIFNMLSDSATGRLTKAQKALVEKGDMRAAEMARLVDDFLNVARISDGRFQYLFSVQDLNLLVGKIQRAFEGVAAEKGVTLSLETDEKLEPFPFDPEKVSILIQNLVDNAIKYTSEGGRITIATQRMKGMARIRVSDTGIGISHEEQGRLFQKFFRSKGATQMFTDGSGLGLFIVKSIVDGHRGSIVVESEEGEGTTFTVEIPLKQVDIAS